MKGTGEECVSIVECKRILHFPLKKKKKKERKKRGRLCLKISKAVLNKYTMTVNHVTDSWPVTNKTTVQTLMTVKMSKSHIGRPVILVRTAEVRFSEET
jgi:hypothetical protein